MQTEPARVDGETPLEVSPEELLSSAIPIAKRGYEPDVINSPAWSSLQGDYFYALFRPWVLPDAGTEQMQAAISERFLEELRLALRRNSRGQITVIMTRAAITLVGAMAPTRPHSSEQIICPTVPPRPKAPRSVLRQIRLRVARCEAGFDKMEASRKMFKDKKEHRVIMTNAFF